jgi:hypothetical protein
MKSCSCAKYDDLELYRHNIDRRIRETRGIKKGLTLLAEHPNNIHRLFRCEVCGQSWQSTYAWNWGGKEYIYRVPAISIEDWLTEPYIRPDELLIYNAMISNWYEKAKPGESDRPCRREGCPNRAIKGLAQCLDHHIEDLQRVHALPERPQGRWFPPYKRTKD